MYEEHNFISYLQQQRTCKRRSAKPGIVFFTGLGICCVLGIILSFTIIRLFIKYGRDVCSQFPLRAADYSYYKSPKTFGDKLAKAAESIINKNVRYDASYSVIDYPGGDVPPDKGVCSDVVVRAYRKLGIDLQVKIHEDIRSAWSSYPHKWGMTKPDTNIDHRRVFNLMAFFKRHGKELANSLNVRDYKPGDIVVWGISRGRAHIGVVSTRVNFTRSRYLIVHNMGRGQIFEDILFDWPIIGHYRYKGR